MACASAVGGFEIGPVKGRSRGASEYSSGKRLVKNAFVCDADHANIDSADVEYSSGKTRCETCNPSRNSFFIRNIRLSDDSEATSSYDATGGARNYFFICGRRFPQISEIEQQRRQRSFSIRLIHVNPWPVAGLSGRACDTVI
jgi:hypothetical protein